MSIDTAFSVKKDIRNNPVARELDGRQKREFRTVVALAGLTVALLLFSAWQHYKVLEYNIAIEDLHRKQVAEETINRQLRLNLETARAPQHIDQRARTELGLVAPAARDTLIIERTHGRAPSASVVAFAR
jgi:hypothetical protein